VAAAATHFQTQGNLEGVASTPEGSQVQLGMH
jgi:hypothetical protein